MIYCSVGFDLREGRQRKIETEAGAFRGLCNPRKMASLAPISLPSPSSDPVDKALEIFRLAFQDREFWISTSAEPPTAVVGKKPPLAAANLGAIIADVSRALVCIYFPVAVKARQQLINLERLIRRLIAANHIGFVVIDNISYEADEFIFHYILYGEIRSGTASHPMDG